MWLSVGPSQGSCRAPASTWWRAAFRVRGAQRAVQVPRPGEKRAAHHLCREHLCDGDLAADLGHLTVALVNLGGSGGTRRLGLLVEYDSATASCTSCFSATGRPPLVRESARSHIMSKARWRLRQPSSHVDPPARKAGLGDTNPSPPGRGTLGGHPHVVVADVRMAHALAVLAHVLVIARSRCRGPLGTRNIDCADVAPHPDRCLPEPRGIRRAAHSTRRTSPRQQPSSPSRIAGDEIRRVGACLRLRHRECGEQVAFQKRAQVALFCSAVP